MYAFRARAFASVALLPTVLGAIYGPRKFATGDGLLLMYCRNGDAVCLDGELSKRNDDAPGRRTD
jgi:hypothetical protein